MTVLVLLLVLVQYVPQWAEQKVREEIEGISFLTYDSLDIDVSQRSLKIYNLSGVKEAFSGSVDTLEISGLKLFALLKSRKFVIDDIIAKGLDLKYRLNKKKEKNSTGKQNEIDIPEFRIASIQVENASFSVYKHADELIFATNLTASLQDLNDADLSKPAKITTKVKMLEADSAKLYTADGLYTIDIGVAKYIDHSLLVKNVSVRSDLAKEDIGKYIGHEVDWLNVSVDSIDIDIEDPATFLKTPLVRSIDIYRPVIDVFRDKRLPSPKNHKPSLLRHILASKKYTFAFDSIRIHDGLVVYEEFVKEEKGPGETSFHRINAEITELKSYSMGLTQRPRLVASCFLYDKAQVFMDASFPMNEQSSETLVKGKMMPVDITLFNRMIRYVSIVEIKSGYSKMMEFDFSYDETRSSGEMKFAYNDLAIAFLEKQESEPDGVISAVKSFFVNSFVVDSNNDFQSNKFRMGKIEFERDPEKSIFNYWWGSIISGIKSSTGVDTTGEKIDVN